MSGLDIAALAILLFMIALGIGAFVFLGSWPGRVATRRNHPYFAAIQIGGWVTLVGGGIFWPLVLMWAFAGGQEPISNSEEAIERDATKQTD